MPRAKREPQYDRASQTDLHSHTDTPTNFHNLSLLPSLPSVPPSLPLHSLNIILPVLDVIPTQDLDLADVLVALPLQKVDLLQELLLVVLELPHGPD